jgi:hypothetical protein
LVEKLVHQRAAVKVDPSAVAKVDGKVATKAVSKAAMWAD